jgi:hypothetical protein
MIKDLKKLIRVFTVNDGADTVTVNKPITFASTVSLPDVSVQVGDLSLASAKIIVGNSSNKATAVDMSGDATISNAGAVTIGSAKVTSAMLANGAGWAAMLTAGLGNSATYAKTTSGAQVLSTGTAGTKSVMFIVTVTEAFVTNDTDTQPTFSFGQVGNATKFADTSLLTDATLGAIKIFTGSLTASTNLIVTGVPAVGTGTGAISVMAIILPAES